MIVEELVLHNFGIFRGRHAVDLRPKSASKPIVLVGALNGSGKTTLLDALQLSLYGKFASCSNRGTSAYLDYLDRSVNRDTDPMVGAGLELQFRHTREGTEDVYRVNRSWRKVGKGTKESVEVLRNGKLDQLMTDRWYEYVDEFMPAQIARLFFFDGEKIETLADPENSAALLRTGIRSLLGLDLVDQLAKDLSVVEARRQTELQTREDRRELQALDEAISAIEAELESVSQELASIRNELDGLEKREAQLRDEFRAAGGDVYERRNSIEVERRALKQRQGDADDKLRELAAGPTPLLLVTPLLNRAKQQADVEASAGQIRLLQRVLSQRDSELVSRMMDCGAKQSVVSAVKKYLEEDREKREGLAGALRYIGMSPGSFEAFSLEQQQIQEEAVQRHIQLAGDLQERLAGVDREMASIPDPETLQGISNAISEVEEEKRRTLVRMEVMRRERESKQRLADERKRARQRRLESAVNKDFVDERTRRVLKHSQKARQTLDRFREAVTQQHLSRLEESILESFSLLLRKSGFVHRLEIDPGSYHLNLYSDGYELIRPERLSAGERQLLAVAILWGLAKASGRPLPCIVDTPLGRLDSAHRTHLVENYFPYASHQVILLSTDEEIAGGYYESLKRSVGREYLIHYDPSERTSVFVPGYFH